MKNLKTTMMATAALTLVATQGWAGENKAYLNQTGNSNTADIEQVGSDNRAGSGSSQGWNMNQTGNGNTLTVDQSGFQNLLGRTNNRGAFDDGLPANQVPTAGWSRSDGVDQTGNSNTLTVDQTGGRQEIGAVNQVTSAGAAGNTLTLIQNDPAVGNYSNNGIFDVYQRNTAGGAKNTASITQTAGGFQAGARVFIVTQDGHTNGMTIDQTGNKNVVTKASQVGNSNTADIDQLGGTSNWVGELEQAGNSNIAKVLQDGSQNEVVGVRQIGNGNIFDLSLDGNQNGGYVGFGVNVAGNLGLTAGLFQQLGNGNMFDGSALGDGNVLASSQVGDMNQIIGTVVGNDNQAAVIQAGSNNFADFSQAGNMNVVAISQ